MESFSPTAQASGGLGGTLGLVWVGVLSDRCDKAERDEGLREGSNAVTGPVGQKVEGHGVLESEGWGDRRRPEGPFAVSGTEVVELMRTRVTVAMAAAVGKGKITGGQ